MNPPVVEPVPVDFDAWDQLPAEREPEAGGWFGRAVDAFVPRDGASVERVRRSRVLVGGSLLSAALLAALLLLRLFLEGGLTVTVALMGVGLVGLLMPPAVLRVTGNHALAGAVVPAACTVLLGVGAYYNGGLHSLAAYSFPAPVLLAAFFVGPRFAAVVAAVFVVETGALYALSQADHLLPPAPDRGTYEHFLAPGMAALVVFSSVLGGLYERERRRAARALRRSRMRYALAAEGASDVLWDWDLRRGDLVFSRRLDHLLDRERPALGEVIHPDDRPTLRAALQAHLEDGAPCRVDVRLRHADGSWRWFEVRGLAERDAEGRPWHMAGSLTDVTRARQAEAARDAQARELVRSNEELERFAYAISHDLQEPLKTVAGFADLLDRRAGDALDEEARRYLGFVQDAAARMTSMVRELLSYARVGQGGDGFEDVSLEDALEAARESLRAALAEHDAVLTSDPLPTVHGNAGLLTRLLQNLLGNAIKFRGERRPELHVGARRTDGTWEIRVRDNGIGMDRAQQERSFELFRRLHADHGYEGTGVGLAVCKKIVEAHGGRIGVESAPGEGTTFHFTLPAARGGES